ncbi:hypothetical protein F0562_010980 [Nyssa sinensis]|uniref:Uncharacterized protein n=1 Tax=Nyssa sinensis TaxID=561372 RepID=A0A5J5A5G1_9ASTE|nr:hypothetical protein F0562_010980 [Nyssa sinensis]
MVCISHSGGQVSSNSATCPLPKPLFEFLFLRCSVRKPPRFLLSIHRLISSFYSVRVAAKIDKVEEIAV